MPNITQDSHHVGWNVLTGPWLQTINLNSEPQVYSPLDALKRAKEIRCIAFASTLDFFATHRFLLTLLYWKADKVGGIAKLRDFLLKTTLPPQVFEAIEAEENHFKLFHNEVPFLQDLSVKNTGNKGKKSAGSLFAELASGTNVAHFHHGDDKKTRLCLPCTTLGMLRLIPWSQAGGRGLHPSLHNAPPIMAIASGKSLASTLGLNLVPLEGNEGRAQWSGHFKPSDAEAAIPYLEAFTWNPRRVLLGLPKGLGTCWLCGKSGVAVVGPITYKGNENTKAKKDGNKKILFPWQDPAAFYPIDESDKYKTMKSTGGKSAATSYDLRALIAKKDSPPPQSMVIKGNSNHHSWQLVIPCTNPKNNKTYDHRQLDLRSLEPDSIREYLSSHRLPQRTHGLDGWRQPTPHTPPKGTERFVQAAVRLLRPTDWVALSNSAYQDMHDSPAGFDVLSGLYWGLRNKGLRGLPSRKVAWLVLKLMASVPSFARMSHNEATFCPLDTFPKRQLDGRGKEKLARSMYPVSFPQGRRLEAGLRNALDKNMRQRNPERIDWTGLCDVLDQLIG